MRAFWTDSSRRRPIKLAGRRESRGRGPVKSDRGVEVSSVGGVRPGS